MTNACKMWMLSILVVLLIGCQEDKSQRDDEQKGDGADVSQPDDGNGEHQGDGSQTTDQSGNDSDKPEDPNGNPPEGVEGIPEQSAVLAESIAFPPDGRFISVPYGECVDMKQMLIVQPEGASLEHLSWSFPLQNTWPNMAKSSVTIDDKGILCLVKDGYYPPSGALKLVVSIENSGVEASCNIEPVLPENVSVVGVSVEPSELSLYIGQTHSLAARVIPAYASQKSLKYEVDNGYITIDEDGLITAVSQGISKVTVRSAANSSYAAECKVTVYDSDIRNMKSEPLEIDSRFASQWSDEVKRQANCASEVDNLTRVEKEVYYYTNLMRMNPALFAETYAMLYRADDSYFNSLIETLKSASPMGTLCYSSAMFDLAYCFADQGGKKFEMGTFGHDRTGTGCTYGYAGECVAWKGTDYTNGLDIVMQFLVDYGVPNYGHRKVFMTGDLKNMGVSAQKSKIGGQFVVVDFER